MVTVGRPPLVRFSEPFTARYRRISLTAGSLDGYFAALHQLKHVVSRNETLQYETCWD
jgi:hypothetical protein